jgi:hypothetical protein
LFQKAENKSFKRWTFSSGLDHSLHKTFKECKLRNIFDKTQPFVAFGLQGQKIKIPSLSLVRDQKVGYRSAVLPQFLTWYKPGGCRSGGFKVSEYMLGLLPSAWIDSQIQKT